jgi:hypothetical protein
MVMNVLLGVIPGARLHLGGGQSSASARRDAASMATIEKRISTPHSRLLSMYFLGD